jgi:hypothetical protein
MTNLVPRKIVLGPTRRLLNYDSYASFNLTKLRSEIHAGVSSAKQKEIPGRRSLQRSMPWVQLQKKRPRTYFSL